MPRFSTQSKMKLETCHEEIQRLLNESIKYFDFTVVFGHRSREEQFDLFKRGRVNKNGIWVIDDKSRVVTYCDGITKLSEHNKIPSNAVDIIPYPTGWKDEGAQHFLAGKIKGISVMMQIPIICGCDWDDDENVKEHRLRDWPHIQIKK